VNAQLIPPAILGAVPTRRKSIPTVSSPTTPPRRDSNVISPASSASGLLSKIQREINANPVPVTVSPSETLASPSPTEDEAAQVRAAAAAQSRPPAYPPPPTPRRETETLTPNTPQHPSHNQTQSHSPPHPPTPSQSQTVFFPNEAPGSPLLSKRVVIGPLPPRGLGSGSVASPRTTSGSAITPRVTTPPHIITTTSSEAPGSLKYGENQDNDSQDLPTGRARTLSETQLPQGGFLRKRTLTESGVNPLLPKNESEKEVKKEKEYEKEKDKEKTLRRQDSTGRTEHGGLKIHLELKEEGHGRERSESVSSPKKQEKSRFLARLSSMPAMNFFKSDAPNSPGNPIPNIVTVKSEPPVGSSSGKRQSMGVEPGGVVCPPTPREKDPKRKSPPLSPRSAVTPKAQVPLEKANAPDAGATPTPPATNLVASTSAPTVAVGKKKRKSWLARKKRIKDGEEAANRETATGYSSKISFPYRQPEEDEILVLEDTPCMKFMYDPDSNVPRVRSASVDALVEHLVSSPYLGRPSSSFSSPSSFSLSFLCFTISTSRILTFFSCSLR
jgi:hypothetical protein